MGPLTKQSKLEIFDLNCFLISSSKLSYSVWKGPPLHLQYKAVFDDVAIYRIGTCVHYNANFRIIVIHVSVFSAVALLTVWSECAFLLAMSLLFAWLVTAFSEAMRWTELESGTLASPFAPPAFFCPAQAARYKTHVFLQWRTQLDTITLFPPNHFLWDRYYWHGGLEWEVGPHTGQQYHF